MRGVVYSLVVRRGGAVSDGTSGRDGHKAQEKCVRVVVVVDNDGADVHGRAQQ